MRGVFAFLFVFVFIGAADAAQSCLALNTSTDCGHTMEMDSGLVNWSAECAKAYTISGIAGCSKSDVSYTRASADAELAQEVYCFCKVYAPFESGWQYAMPFGDAYSCRQKCAYYCANGFVIGRTDVNVAFREKIIVPVK